MAGEHHHNHSQPNLPSTGVIQLLAVKDFQVSWLNPESFPLTQMFGSRGLGQSKLFDSFEQARRRGFLPIDFLVGEFKNSSQPIAPGDPYEASLENS
jgi:hypothetical protein